jgi:hypothetical protein
MAEHMTEQEFEEVLYEMLRHEQAPGLPKEHVITGVFRSHQLAGMATQGPGPQGPGLVVRLANGAEFEISIHKRRLP